MTFAGKQIELAVIAKYNEPNSERQTPCVFLSYVVIVKLDCQLDRI